MERPVWEMLREQRGRMSLHMPGHKGKAPFGEMELYGLDTTELPGTDDLYCTGEWIEASGGIVCPGGGKQRSIAAA